MFKKRLRLDPIDRNCDPSINWGLCCLCMQGGDLICPLKSNSPDNSDAYKTLANNLKKLHSLSSLPANINLDLLNDGGGIEQTLTKNSASWHRECYNQCRKKTLTKLENVCVNYR